MALVPVETKRTGMEQTRPTMRLARTRTVRCLDSGDDRRGENCRTLDIFMDPRESGTVTFQKGKEKKDFSAKGITRESVDHTHNASSNIARNS